MPQQARSREKHQDKEASNNLGVALETLQIYRTGLKKDTKKKLPLLIPQKQLQRYKKLVHRVPFPFELRVSQYTVSECVKNFTKIL